MMLYFIKFYDKKDSEKDPRLEQMVEEAAKNFLSFEPESPLSNIYNSKATGARRSIYKRRIYNRRLRTVEISIAVL